MTMIRLSGSQLHAARVLVGLTLDDLAERTKLCRHSIRKWETSSHAIPSAMYTHLCRAVDLLSSQGRASTRWSLRAARLHQLRTIARVYMSPMGLAARRPSRRRISHASMSGSPDLRRSQWCAARLPSDSVRRPQLLSTLTDEFAFRRISRIDVRVLPIQIEHRGQDIAASTPPLPCADYLAVTKAQD